MPHHFVSSNPAAQRSVEDAQRLGVTPILALFLIGLVLLPFVKSRHQEAGAS